MACVPKIAEIRLALGDILTLGYDPFPWQGLTYRLLNPQKLKKFEKFTTWPNFSVTKFYIFFTWDLNTHLKYLDNYS